MPLVRSFNRASYSNGCKGDKKLAMGVTFALVHGAWHGAWCWERLIPALDERGCGALAMDLPCEDVEAGLDAYADVIADALEGSGNEVVLVGHSLGGLPLPLVAARRPLRSVVYLASFVPLAGQSMADQFATSPEPILLFEGGGREMDELGRSRWTDPGTTAGVLYPDLSEGDARWAFERLRPQAQLSQTETHPGGLPPVPGASVVCTGDRCLNPDWSRRVTRERLGVEPIELDAGHFAMIAEPEALADALITAAGRGPSEGGRNDGV
jgi:pimeloyl-ACP methyl ester carboxylesterase